MQITQFLVGSTYAALHLFISYTVPVSVAYKITEKVASQVNPSSVPSAVSSATDAVSAALPTVTGAAVAFLRQLIYRAAGDEGLAENIAVPGSPLMVQQQQPVVAGQVEDKPAHHFFKNTVEKIVYRNEYKSVPCIDTSGQAFAVYLNLIYLAPLTILFMRFFFKSYLRRTSPSAKHQTKHSAIAKATHDATHGVERELESLGKSAEDGFSTAVKKSKDVLRGRKVSANGTAKDERHGSLSPANKKFVDSVNRKVTQRLQEIDETTESTRKQAKDVAKDVVDKVSEKVEQIKENGTPKENGTTAKDNGTPKEEQPVSQPGTPQSKKAKQRAAKKAREQADKDADEQTTEKEPEPKDLNNTLDKGEGKGLF